jgi:hypothetical protein
MPTPQMPTPVAIRYAIATRNRIVSSVVSANPAYQPQCVGRDRTMSLILSEMLAYE